MKNALEVSHLTKDYGSFKLDDVSFTVPGGTIMGLIGENGAGKSHHHQVHSQPDPPGRRGDPGTGAGQSEGRAGRQGPGGGWCWTRPPSTTDSPPPRWGKILSKLYPGWDAALYQRYLNKFGLTGKKPVKTFSKGMKMKLSLAAAFAARPKLLILDEATSGLDPVVRDEILDEFFGLHPGRGARHSPVQPHHQRSGEGGGLRDLPAQGKGGGVRGQGRAAGHLRPPGVLPAPTWSRWIPPCWWASAPDSSAARPW